MRFRPLFPLSLCFSTCAIIMAVQAQGVKKAPAPALKNQNPAPDPKQDGNVTVRGENSISDDNTKISRLTKNVVVTQAGEDFILYAQSLVYNGNTNKAVATGSLRVETRDSTIRGNRIDANFDTKTLTLTGDVVVSTHGKSDGITGTRTSESVRSQISRKASKIYCERVDWDYETHEATLTTKAGRIRIEQDKSFGTCNRILYDERQNVAQLLGNVQFTDEKGQIFRSPDLTVYIDENRTVTNGLTVLDIKRQRDEKAPPRPVKPPVRDKKAPKISDEDLKIFDLAPPPIPAASPVVEEPATLPTPSSSPTSTPTEPEKPAAE